MMQIFQRSTGVEELLDQVEEVLIRSINPALEEVYSRRQEADEARAQRRQLPYQPLTYDEVPPSHFHTGNFPSLALEEVPPDDYPYVVLTIEEYAPSAESARNDHLNVFRDVLVVHALARANEGEGSEVVFRRAIRMGEAVFLTLASETSMRSALSAFDNPTRGQHSIPWTHQYGGHGATWWFQSVGTSYALRSYSTMND